MTRRAPCDPTTSNRWMNYQRSDADNSNADLANSSHAGHRISSLFPFPIPTGGALKKSSTRASLNICAVDLSNAFDRINHYGLFTKLMKKKIPVNLLLSFEHWFAIGVTCVKWGSVMSRFISLVCGIR